MSSPLDNFKTRPLMSSSYINGIYIPSTLLVLGTLIVKSEWVGYAIALSLLLSGWKIFNNEPQKVLAPKTSHSFPLTSKTILSHNTAIYRFSLPSKTSILGLPTGQHIKIRAQIPWASDPNAYVSRSYTPITSDHDPGYFELLIKAYPTGNISRLLAQLPIGGNIEVSGPTGAMKYKPGMAKRLGMIAGGSGITPMLQIMRAIRRGRSSGDDTEVDLIFANVSEADILLREDLDALAAEDEGIRVRYVLNEPPRDKLWEGGVGFVSKEMVREWLPKPDEDVKVLVCGPLPMVSAMRRVTEECGFEKARGASRMEDQVFCF